MLGKSIFMEFHEQGMGHMIGGFYTYKNVTDEFLKERLLAIIGQKGFGERDGVVIIDHTKEYAKHLLGEEMEEKTRYVLDKFFPEALRDVATNGYMDDFGFVYRNSKADEFIWNNRLHAKVQEFIRVELQRSSEEYMAKRKAQKAAERAEAKQNGKSIEDSQSQENSQNS